MVLSFCSRTILTTIDFYSIIYPLPDVVNFNLAFQISKNLKFSKKKKKKERKRGEGKVSSSNQSKGFKGMLCQTNFLL